MSQLLFVLVALATAVSALMVVRTKDLVHAVLYLALVLLGTAVIYGLLEAPFLAGVQVLTYIGGVVTLMIFGVMVTRHHGGASPPAETADGARGLIVALGFFAVLAAGILQTDFGPMSAVAAPGPKALARQLLDDHLLAFEAASLLLLAAIIGAVVLARKRDPAPASSTSQQRPGALAGGAE